MGKEGWPTHDYYGRVRVDREWPGKNNWGHLVVYSLYYVHSNKLWGFIYLMLYAIL